MENNKNQKFTYDIHELPSLKWIFFARALDMLFSVIPGLFFSFIIKVNDWKSALILVSVSFVWMFFYFVVFAYICKGNTLGKLMTGIKLVKKGDKKITFLDTTRRETYHCFIPWFIFLVIQIIIILIAYYENYDGESKYYTTLCLTLKNIGVLFYVAWFAYVGLTIKMQEDHQSAIDYRLNILCIKNGYVKISKPDDEVVKMENVHLGENKPGSININELNELLEEKTDE